MTAILRPRSGPASPLAVDEWRARATPSERSLLASVDGPVLDVGCGPGRLVEALAERGTTVLGVDASPIAVGQAIDRGCPALCRSVFDTLPGEGRWRTVLLFDGNIGIGGNPIELLRRASSLVHPTGSVLVEVGAPGSTTAVTEARVEVPGHRGPWFPWAWVGADRLGAYADAAGLLVVEWLRPSGRWLARLQIGGP